MVLKHNIVCQICPKCDTYLYPPTEVSVIGQEDYEESFRAPESEKMITSEKLAKINEGRAEQELLLLTKEEWEEGYRLWTQTFRNEVRTKAQTRHDDLVKGAPKIKELRIIEETRAFKVVGKRWRAVYVPIEKGWELHCPNCGTMTLKWEQREE